MAEHNVIGKIGEDLAVKHLVKHKFKILEKNYRQKWGEIDVIAKKGKILHFVEVKTVSCETQFNEYMPEENVSYFKRKKLARAINTYLVSHETLDDREVEFQIDVFAILFDPFTKNSKIRVVENVLL